MSNTVSTDVKIHRFKAMASPCALHLPADHPHWQEVADAIEAEVRRIEQKYSRYRDDSVLSQINQNAGQQTPLDGETTALLGYARECFRQSDSLFDISSGILRQAWNFREPALPESERLSPLLRRIGLERIRLEDNLLLMPPDMQLDLGGIGKEYAADAAAGVARRLGVTWGIIDLGGDLQVIGPRPDPQGSAPWMLGVRHPRIPEKAIASLPVAQGGMATSGDYERFFELDGQRYCHLLNPQTGFPVSHWASVTVVAPTCLLAGTLSSIAMLKEASAEHWLREQEVPALMIRPDLSLISF